MFEVYTCILSGLNATNTTTRNFDNLYQGYNRTRRVLLARLLLGLCALPAPETATTALAYTAHQKVLYLNSLVQPSSFETEGGRRLQ